MSTVGTVKAILRLDAAQFSTAIKQASGGLDRFADKAQKTGKQLTKSVTAPLVGIGAAAVKSAMDFDASMTQIQSLVGLSAKTVDGFRQDVKRLSGETARSPKELADAMFFIASAGLRGSKATDALRVSAQAAAIGLGDTVVVADAVTNAMNGYGDAIGGAEEATDILIKTVEQGKASAADLAPQFGQLIPMAAQMEIGFDEVGGALAFLTRASGNAAQSSTQFKAIMTSLIKPTSEAEKAMEKIGMTTDDLHAAIGEDFHGALMTLREDLEAQNVPLTEFFTSVEGLSAVFQLTGSQAGAAAEVFDAMADSAGATEKAMAIAAETAKFQFDSAMTQVKTSLVELGMQLLPIAVDLFNQLQGAVKKVTDFFNNLSPGMQKIVIGLGAFAAAAGPALMVVGSLIKNIKLLKTTLTGAHPALLVLTAAVATFGFIMAKRSAEAKEFEDRVKAAGESLKEANPLIAGVTDRLEELASSLPEAADPMKDLADEAKEVAKQSFFVKRAIDQGMGPAFKKLRDSGVEFAKIMEKDVSGLDDFITALDETGRMSGQTQKEFFDLSDEGQQLARHLADLHDAGEITTGGMRDLLDSVDESRIALNKATEASKESAREFLESDKVYRILEESLHMNTKAADDYYLKLKEMADDEGPRVALRMLERDVEAVATEFEFATAEFQIFANEAEEVATKTKKVSRTFEELRDQADYRAISFRLELNTEGLYEQLNEAMQTIIDVGSLMPGGDSTALDTQLAITRRISAKLIDTKASDRSAASSAVSEARKAADQAFNNFVKGTLSVGGAGITESFFESIIGSPQQIMDAFDGLFDKAFEAGLTQIPELRSTFQKMVEARTKLTAMSITRKKLVEDQTRAEDQLAGALERQAQASDALSRATQRRDQAALQTASQFGFAFSEEYAAPAQAKRLLAAYTAFETNLKSLQEKGFPSDIIQQVVGLGAFAGNETATSLLAMGDTDFEEFTTALSGIRGVAGRIGAFSAEMLYGADVTSATGGLASADQLVATAKDLARQERAEVHAQTEAMIDLASAVQNEFGTGIRTFVEGLGELPDGLAQSLAAFIADLDATIRNTSKGGFDLRQAALGVIPTRGSAIIGGARTGGGSPGTASNPLVVVPVRPPGTGQIERSVAPLVAKDQLTMGGLDVDAAVSAGPRRNKSAQIVADVMRQGPFAMADLGAMGSTVMNINVTNADPEAVVEILRKYNREQGEIPADIGFY